MKLGREGPVKKPALVCFRVFSRSPFRPRDTASHGNRRRLRSSITVPMVKVKFPGCRAIEDHGTYVVARGLLDASQLKKADRYFGGRSVQAKVADAKVNETGRDAYKRRRSKVAFLDVREQPWLFRRLSGISKACDAAKFKALTYRADGVVQPRYDELQYSEYHGSEGGHFGTWHLDAHEGGSDDEDQRELAVVLMLSDSKAYTGGKLEVKRGRGGKNPGSMYTAGLVGKRLVSDVKLEAGDAVVFPAKKVWHRVTKTRSGLRRTVVFWVSAAAGGGGDGGGSAAREQAAAAGGGSPESGSESESDAADDE